MKAELNKRCPKCNSLLIFEANDEVIKKKVKIPNSDKYNIHLSVKCPFCNTEYENGIIKLQ